MNAFDIRMQVMKQLNNQRCDHKTISRVSDIVESQIGFDDPEFQTVVGFTKRIMWAIGADSSFDPGDRLVLDVSPEGVVKYDEKMTISSRNEMYKRNDIDTTKPDTTKEKQEGSTNPDTTKKNQETFGFTATKPKFVPIDMLQLTLDDFENDVPPEFGFEIVRTNAALPSFITGCINRYAKKEYIGQKKACSQMVASGVSFMHECLGTPVLRAARINEELLESIQWWTMADETSTALVKSANTSIKNISIKRNGELAVKPVPVYIHEKARGYISSMNKKYRLKDVDCLRLVTSKGIMESVHIFGGDAEPIKKIAEKEIEVILKEVTETANESSRERRMLYLHNKRYMGEKGIVSAEKQMKRIDKIYGTPHCKYCLSNDTKLNRRKGDKNQYRCQNPECGRLFTITNKEFTPPEK